MTKKVNEIIFKAFLRNLSENEITDPETIKGIRSLLENNEITEQRQLSKLVKEMEARYVENKSHKGS